jgi:hypothetical protein
MFKKALLGASASALMFGAMATPAFAAGAGDGSQASPCGASHGAFADVNGNFGFLGNAGGTPGYHGDAVGQDPGATGYNNSHTDCQSL